MSERRCAQMIHVLSQAQPMWPAADELGLDPATDAHQVEHAGKALSSPIALLTGSPGTGKTHCAAAVIRATLRGHGCKVAVCAPTGKAAVRISEKLADAGLPIKATTVHALLKVSPVEGGHGDGWGFAHGPDNPLPYSHVFLDETSMMDVGLSACLLSALTPSTNLMLIGDKHQLPPVGHGAFLRDLIAAELPRGELSEIRRNAGRIVTACHEIKDGKTPRLPDDLGAWLKDDKSNLIQLPWPKGTGRDRGQAMRERLDYLYDWLGALPQVKEWKWSLIDDVQVIVARNATRTALNTHLQQRLNAAGQKGPHGPYRVGDKVICLKNGFVVDAEDRNHKQVFCCNGDVGRVKGFHGKQMVVKLANPTRTVLVPLTRAAKQEQAQSEETAGVGGNWDLAYAVTCWKYQGSEVQVAICLLEPAGRLGSRELAYTMISRARSLCVLLGDQQELRKYVGNVTLPARKTFLKELLTGGMPC